MRMTCVHSCQDPNPSSEFLQDLVDPSCTIVFQSPSAKDYSTDSPHLAGAETGFLSDVLYCTKQTSSKTDSPSGESFSDCSLSDFGTSPSQDSYSAHSMEQGFCPPDDLFSAGTYPSPGSVASNPTRWSTQGYYVAPRQNDGVMTFESFPTSHHIQSGPPSDIYEASSGALCSPAIPVSGLESFSYSMGPQLQSPSIPAFSNPWIDSEIAPVPRSVNPSSMHRHLSHASQWLQPQSHDQVDSSSQHHTQTQDLRSSQSLGNVRSPSTIGQLVSDTVGESGAGPANKQGPQNLHIQTPKSEQAALTPASGPIPLYRVEPWHSGAQQAHLNMAGDAGHLHSQVQTTNGLDSANLNSSASGPSQILADNGEDGTELVSDEILVEANDLEPARKSGPLYNVKPEEDGQYYCPYAKTESCNHPPTKLKCNYDKYIDAHIKPHRCKNPECRDLRFSSTACRLRHEREAHGSHGHGVRPYLCKYPECDRSKPGNGFPRSWNRNDHMKRVHDHTFIGENEDITPTSATKPQASAVLANSKGSMKRKQPPDLAPREESVKKAKRSEEKRNNGSVASLSIQQRVDAVQGQWRQQWTEAHRQLHALKGPLQITAAQELETTVKALLASSFQLSELVGNHSWLISSE